MTASFRHRLTGLRQMLSELAGIDLRRRTAWREMIARIDRMEQTLARHLPPPLPK